MLRIIPKLKIGGIPEPDAYHKKYTQTSTLAPKIRLETYPKSFYFKPIDPHQKRPFLGVCAIKYFFNFRDMIMIQNMKNIKSKFRIDLEYFSQHLSI